MEETMRETKMISEIKKENDEFIDFFVKKYKLKLLKSMYYSCSSYYYDSQENILYKLEQKYDKYNRRLLFEICHDMRILKYNNITTLQPEIQYTPFNIISNYFTFSSL